MTDLIITGAVAERVRKLAEQEKRSIEDVINTALDQTYVDPNLKEPTQQQIYAHLRRMPGIHAPSENPPPPPFSDEEMAEIAKRAGANGSISAEVIEERKQGW